MTLDAILGAAVEAWRRWVAEHPDVALDSEEDEPNALIYEAQREIADSLTPDDEGLIQQLACEPRVWSYRRDGTVLEPPLAFAAACTIEDFVCDHLDQLRHGTERVTRPSQR